MNGNNCQWRCDLCTDPESLCLMISSAILGLSTSPVNPTTTTPSKAPSERCGTKASLRRKVKRRRTSPETRKSETLSSLYVSKPRATSHTSLISFQVLKDLLIHFLFVSLWYLRTFILVCLCRGVGHLVFLPIGYIALYHLFPVGVTHNNTLLRVGVIASGHFGGTLGSGMGDCDSQGF